MNKRVYWLMFSLILIFGFVIRILPVLGNNFHFTMDQGDDAVHVREIVERSQPLLVGPETNIPGIFTGPLWYYLLAIGYAVFLGHPASVVIILIFFNLLVSAILIYQLCKHVSPTGGLLVGAALQFFWWFYDTSRYGFNPFPLAGLSILIVLLFCHGWEKFRHQPYLIAILVGLGLNSEIAGGMAIAICVCLIFLYLFARRKLSWQKIVISLFIMGVFLIPKIIFQFQNDFVTFHKIKQDVFSSQGVYSESNFLVVGKHYLEILVNASTPGRPILAIVFWGLILFILKKHRIWRKTITATSEYPIRFVGLSLVFAASSFVFFATNNGWRDWHTVSVPPLLFISLLLLIFMLPKNLKFGLLTLVLGFQGLYFGQQYNHFNQSTIDQSLLKNELGAIDWIYQNAEGKGFYVYNYLPSVRDYPYQYLFWWHGRKEYGYVPCEYGRYPSVPNFYVPGYKYYQSPQRPCSKLRFLIIEPDENKEVWKQWYGGVTEKTKLLDKASVGRISVEKREILN